MTIRTNLIMHFHCSKCGKQLTLSHNSDGAAKPSDTFGSPQVPKEDTGAACYYTPKISIEPCRHCIEKYTGPAKKLMEAIKGMSIDE